ncbi:MAG TPA: hypothetical protein VF865_16005 [Acidobacteriaceae bacterium]
MLYYHQGNHTCYHCLGDALMWQGIAQKQRVPGEKCGDCNQQHP